MQFHTDGIIENKAMPFETSLTRSLLASLSESRTHDIKDFLRRPVLISTGQWTTAQTQGTELLSMNVPEDVFTNTQYSEKISGFLGFRAKAVIRVQINAQRFQQGRLLLHYFPQGQVNTQRREITEQSMVLRTQTPRVELDCASISEATLEMPYVSPTLYYNTLNQLGPIGRFMLCVYSPLLSTDTNVVNYTVWCHFEDVELEFPTVPTGDQPFRFGAQMDDDGPFRYEAQMAKKRVKNGTGVGRAPEEVEAAAMQTGPLSGALSAVSKAGTVLSGVPVIGTVAKTVGWAAGIGSKIASFFGWSNPLQTAQANRMWVSRLPYTHNVDGLDMSYSLGFSAENKVQQLPGFAGTDLDEMSLAYIKKIPAYMGTFTWEADDTVGLELWHSNVRPQDFRVQRTVPDGGSGTHVWDHAPFSYVAQFFEQWRGGITFTFKFIKTEFHTGRVTFYFLPTSNASAGAPDVQQRTYLYREVFDLSISNEFTVTVPFASITPYKLYGETIGRVGLQVQNPLVAPSSITQSMNVLWEVSAADDFEVAIPNTQPSFLPIATLPAMDSLVKGKRVPRDAVASSISKKMILAAQGDEGENAAEEKREATVQPVETPIAPPAMNSGGLAPAKFCVGECILSLRQLMKRSQVICGTAAADTAILVRPGWMNLPYIRSGSGVNIALGPLDYTTIFGCLFAYRRGSIRIRFVPSCVNITVGDICAYYNRDVTHAQFSRFPLTYGNCMDRVLFSSLQTGGAEVEVPMYGRVHCYMNKVDTAEPFSGASDLYRDENTVTFQTPWNFNSSDTNGIRIERQIGDDCSFGFFVGVMPLVAAATVNNGTYGLY